MRLERLEISGFKSFPERAHLAFDRGVTAIVGPNGCGKSNVVDAITWVLGEQSVRSLRGERMEDVIFNGSDARRPTAAAEVRLRLTGVVTEAVRRAIERGTVVEPPTDGDGEGQPLQIELPAVDARDVEVARRLYRSGESEYLIDGDVVRLRDVHDLLMDAGIGVKGYAVIEQGKIGQILSAKPTERRQLIEEAAGVTKYKSRRRAAELKLEAAQQNLTRVDDIIFELEKQRNALKRQAAKARRYRKLREELRRWEKLLFARKFRVLTQAIEAAHARLAEARGREGAAAERVAAVQRTVDVVREQLARSEGDALAIRNDVHARQLEMERRQQQLAFDRQQVEALTHGAGQLEGEIEQLVGRREPARVGLELRREAAARAESDRREADAALSAEEESYGRALRGIDALETEVESTRQRTIAGGTAVTALHNVIERAAEARERIVVELGRLEAEAADLEIETGLVRDERDRAADALAAATVSMDEARGAREGVDAELASCRAERESRVRDLREQEREQAGLSARLRSLEELDAAREGYGEAARAILHDGAADLCHFGSVADFLEADRPYERAVEACLAEFLQAVIVRGPEDAARGLAALREQNLGRCAFLMIETGTADPVHDEAERPVSAIPLADVLRITGSHADTIRRAIGPAWIVEDLESARCAAAATGTPVVTPTGEVFRTGRLVFGGGRAGARGILATKREIKELRERLDPEQRRLEALTEALREIEQGIFSGEQRVAGLVADLHHHEKVALEHELRVTRATETLERLARKMELVANERRRAEDERRLLEARQDEARESATRLEREQKDLDDALSAAQGRLTEARAAATDLGRRVADARARQATFSERAAAIGIEVLRLEETAADLEQRIRILTDERQRNEHRRSELAGAIRETIRQLESDDREFAALQARARESEQLVASLQAEFAVQEATVREARVALDGIRAVVGQLDVARATAESDLAHLATSCVETLQASLDEVASEVGELEQAASAAPDVAVICPEDDVDAEDEEAPGADTSSGAEVAAPAEHEREAGGLAARAFTAEEAIAELRAKIDGLGPVNMMAIEQFDELETRYAFLTTQRKDLIDSIAATGEAIKRIDKTTRERFREAYAAINKYFEETFTTLFGGGRAGLVMLDEDDLLESGIDIIAQPPGKRLQNVQLLSGGEKALTAMALLFAMFRYRPSPFCLLDEIDAPLDDANIGRFLEMLRGMLDRTQFIVITHSRKTMEMADRLYGVTMEEPGVSKLISLKLN